MDARRRARGSLRAIVLLAMAIVVIVGCEDALDGQATVTPRSSISSGISPSISPGMSPGISPSISPGISPGVSVGPSPSADAEPDDVALEVEVTSSGARVTIVNRTEGVVTGLDQRAQCSVLILDVEASGSWTPTADCPSGPPPADVSISPGETLVVDLDLQPGTFRVRFPYSPGDRFVPATAKEARSDPFTVG